MKIEPNSKLVMIGDSITDAGRTKPVGEGLFDAEGKGYVSLVKAMLGAVHPERRIRVINMGNGGDTVRDLKARWQRDVIDLKPDWLSIMIGVNDVWRQFDSPFQKELHVDADYYERTLDDLVRTAKQTLKGLVLMTPFFLEPLKDDPMRAMVDRYSAAMKRVADKHGTIFVDTQAAFTDILKQHHSSYLSWDRVHPNATGHMILARAFLKAINFQ